MLNVYELQEQQTKISEGLRDLTRRELKQLIKMYKVKVRWCCFKSTYTIRILLEVHLERLKITWVK